MLFFVLQEDEELDPFSDFPCYNRDYERYQELLQEKEHQWEEELKRLMEMSGNSKPSRMSSIVSNAQAFFSGSKGASGGAASGETEGKK